MQNENNTSKIDPWHAQIRFVALFFCLFERSYANQISLKEEMKEKEPIWKTFAYTYKKVS